MVKTLLARKMYLCLKCCVMCDLTSCSVLKTRWNEMNLPLRTFARLQIVPTWRTHMLLKISQMAQHGTLL